MQSKYSMVSTKKLGGYSAGALSPNFTTLWDPKQAVDVFQGLGGQTSFLLGLSETFPGANITHFVSLDVTATAESPALERARQRLISYLLVSRLPDEALPELCETLGDMYEFYSAHPHTPPALPSPTREIRARLGEKYERPEFYASEE